MKKVLRQIFNVLRVLFNALEADFYCFDDDVMSKEARKILAHPTDRKKYLKAIERLKNPRCKQVTITLSTNETITLTANG